MDRNQQLVDTSKDIIKSLSARRAWIEIWSAVLTELLILVALRKESVDRNMQIVVVIMHALVALRKESVDRNTVLCLSCVLLLRRSPQGERG